MLFDLFIMELALKLNKIIKIGLISLIFGVPVSLVAGNQFLPSTPVVNFKIPFFGENGVREWFIQGQEGIYVNENQCDVKELIIRTFSGGAASHLESTMTSPYATILLKENRVFGHDLIKMTAPEYTVTGSEWEWIGLEKKIQIRQNVKIIFNQSLKSILKS